MKQEINLSQSGDRITIVLPVDLLVFAFENDERNDAKVTNKEIFARAIVETLQGYQTQNSQERGITALQEFMDTIMDEAATLDKGVDWA